MFIQIMPYLNISTFPVDWNFVWLLLLSFLLFVFMTLVCCWGWCGVVFVLVVDVFCFCWWLWWWLWWLWLWCFVLDDVVLLSFLLLLLSPYLFQFCNTIQYNFPSCSVSVLPDIHFPYCLKSPAVLSPFIHCAFLSFNFYIHVTLPLFVHRCRCCPGLTGNRFIPNRVPLVSTRTVFPFSTIWP
jgi:hypothetical protein